MTPSADRAWVIAATSRHQADLVRIRRRLHQLAELSFEERETAGFLASELRAAGLDPIERLGDTWGLLTTVDGAEPGPTIALVAHIDALPIPEPEDLSFHSITPGVMHACGHDMNAAILSTTAIALSAGRDRMSGRVRFIFEPGEELLPGGAATLVEAGVMDGVDAVFGLHQSATDAGTLHLTPGPLMASGDTFRVVVRGTSGHAGAPEATVDAIQVAGAMVTSLHQIVSRRVSPLSDAVLSIGTVNGGTRDNIVADEVVFTGTVRAFEPAVRAALRDWIRECVQGVADAWGATASVAFVLGYPPLVNDERMTAFAQSAATDVLPEGRVVRGGWPPGMPMDDFSRYLELAPGCYAGLGIGTPGDTTHRQPHTSAYRIDESAMASGLAYFLSLAMNFRRAA